MPFGGQQWISTSKDRDTVDIHSRCQQSYGISDSTLGSREGEGGDKTPSPPDVHISPESTLLLPFTFWYRHIWGFPGGAKPPANTGDTGSIPGSGRSPGDGNGNPLRYTCLENPMERGAWWATVHGVTETDTMEPAHACAHTCLWKTRKKLVETKAKSCLKSVVVFCCPPPGACMVPSRDKKWGRRRGQRETEGELNLSLLAWVLTPSIFLLPVE